MSAPPISAPFEMRSHSSISNAESTPSPFSLESFASSSPQLGSAILPVDHLDDGFAVGLSDPGNARNRKQMLGLVNRLHDTGVQTDIDLPMIVVIGNQSAGKSSLIESISGITLPRSSGTCTRCPTECKLSYSDAPWKCLVRLHFSTDARGIPVPVRVVTFGAPITSKSMVEDRIRRAQHAILNPSRKLDQYLYEDLPRDDDNEMSFSKNYVSLEISGPELADLSFVDLPGLIASVGRAGNERDIDLVKSLVVSYIEKPSCVILLTVACETDFENQGAHHLAKSFDPEGKRTVGVLTKPDRIPTGEESAWIKFIRNETEPLVNNWYCVKQPSSQALSKGITWADARRQENEFFAATSPWSSLDPQYQKFLRTSCLIERLSIILSELIEKRLPEIQQELVNAIRDTEARLSELPRAPSSDPVGEVLQVVNSFSKDLSRRVEGTPNKDGLLQAIRPRQQNFRSAIRATVPNFVPWEKKKATKATPKPVFLANEEKSNSNETDEDDVSSDVRELEPPRIYIDEVMDQAQCARTRELPGSYPFVVQRSYISKFTEQWKGPAMDLFDAVYAILKTELGDLAETHFASMGKGTLKQSVLMILNDYLDDAASRTKEKIQWLLELEKTPTTLNIHYYSDYKDKFLAHYRGCRNDSDLMTNLKLSSAKSSSSNQHHTYNQLATESINKALSALNELGISAKTTDLPKLLPLDPMEPALEIMASVRAYFQVAYKRFTDMVPMAIDYEIVLGLSKGIEKVLQDGLQITGPDGYNRCKAMMAEMSSIISARQEVQKKMERLQAARQELKRFM